MHYQRSSLGIVDDQSGSSSLCVFLGGDFSVQAVKLPKQKQQECVEDREEVGRSCVMDLELEPLQTCWVSGYTLSLDLVFERQGF